MSYGISTNAVFGVFLSPDESVALAKAIEKHVANMPKTQDVLDILGDEYDNQAIPFFIDGQYSQTGPNVTLIAEDSHSGAHNTMFEEGFEHCFGVCLSRKGYGSSTSSQVFSQKLAQGPSPQDIALFNNVCAPLLAQAGVTIPPSMVVSSYVA